MVIGGIPHCDFCGEPGRPDPIAVRISYRGFTHTLHFHNTIEEPCLRLFKELIQAIYAASLN
ncbi:MAG: hypothetical protein WBW84_15740 [Acidobacteriaceae bacterium]